MNILLKYLTLRLTEVFVMGKTVISESMFPEIVDLYNSEGKSAAFRFLKDKYGLKNPSCIIDRIKHSSSFSYNFESDSFAPVAMDASDAVFLNLDQLCSKAIAPNRTDPPVIEAESPAPTMEKLIQELISDRLLTLSKYIMIETATRTVLIDRTSLISDGYTVNMH